MLSREQRIVLGIGAALIGIGIGFLVLQLAGLESLGAWIPLISGIIVMILALLTRLPGFSIVGCLLSAAGAGLLWYVYAGASVSAGAAEPVFLLFLSGGMLLIPVFTRFLDAKTLLWPFVPGLVGIVVGILLLL